MKLSSEILAKAAERLLKRLENTTTEELILALQECEDNSASYAFYGHMTSYAQHIIEKHNYPMYINNLSIIYKNAFFNMSQVMVDSEPLESYDACNDEFYELAA